MRQTDDADLCRDCIHNTIFQGCQWAHVSPREHVATTMFPAFGNRCFGISITHLMMWHDYSFQLAVWHCHISEMDSFVDEYHGQTSLGSRSRLWSPTLAFSSLNQHIFDPSLLFIACHWPTTSCALTSSTLKLEGGPIRPFCMVVRSNIRFGY